MPIGGDWSSVFKLRVTKERKQYPDKESNMVGESSNKSCWLGSASCGCSCRGMCAGVENMACLCSQCDMGGQGTAQSTVLATGGEALMPKGLLPSFLPSLPAWPQWCGEPSALLLRNQQHQKSWGFRSMSRSSAPTADSAGHLGAHAPLFEGLQHKILNCSSKHKFSSPVRSSPVGVVV